jgi:hypothetical protein
MVVAAGAREDHELIASSGVNREAKRILKQASDCGPLMEEMGAHLDEDESIELAAQLDRFFAGPQKASTIERIKNGGRLSRRPFPSEAQRERMRRAMRRVCC